MSDVADPSPAAAARPKRGKAGLLLGAAAALLLGGGGFYAVFSGMGAPGSLSAGEGGHGSGHGEPAAPPADIAFVAMEPIMISLPPGGTARHLRFTGQLEVEPEMAAEVTGVMPRIVDV